MTLIFKNKNSFWPEYKNLEQQVLDLTKYVCFCDAQVDVFSRENSNLIIQIVSEIESISKELYRRYADENKSEDQHVINQSKPEQSVNAEGDQNQAAKDDCKPKQSVNADGNQNQAAEDDCEPKQSVNADGTQNQAAEEDCQPEQSNNAEGEQGQSAEDECRQRNGENQYQSFDFCCLQSLDQKWHLTLKEISVTGVNFYFSDKFQSFAPLADVYSDDRLKCQWKDAYDLLKHNNRACIKSATIGNLISALGALFVLNLYYRDLNCDDYKYYLNGDLFDSRVGSDIFSVKCCSAVSLNSSRDMGGESINDHSQDCLNKSIYIKRFDSASFRHIHNIQCLDAWANWAKAVVTPELKPYWDNKNSPEFKGLSIEQICSKLGCPGVITKIEVFDDLKKVFDSDGAQRTKEVILNKYSGFYNKLKLQDRKIYFVFDD